jgi:hypothetical protein
MDNLHKGDNDDDDDDDINNNRKAKYMVHTYPIQCMNNKMLQFCGIKQYTPTEKLRQIGQI